MLGLNFIDIGQGVGGNLHQTKHFMVEMAFTKQSRRYNGVQLSKYILEWVFDICRAWFTKPKYESSLSML